MKVLGYRTVSRDERSGYKDDDDDDDEARSGGKGGVAVYVDSDTDSSD